MTSGTEAIETSIKLAYQYHVQNGQPQRTHYIARRRSYHGNSVTALSLGHDELRGRPFKPILTGHFHHVSPAYAYRGQWEGEDKKAYVERLAAELEQEIIAIGTDKVAAFYAETGKIPLFQLPALPTSFRSNPIFAVLGTTAGCATAPPGYFQAIRSVCDKYGVLLVLDEIMCGCKTATFPIFLSYDTSVAKLRFPQWAGPD